MNAAGNEGERADDGRSAAKRDERSRRVVVAVDGSAGNRADVERAARLARELQADLVGLFVEDPDLAALAHHAQISVLSTIAQLRGQDASLLRHALRSQVEATRRAVEDAGRRLSVRTDFRISRGRGMKTVLVSAESADFIFVARTTAAVASTPGGIAVVFDGSDGAHRAVDTALGLAATEGLALTVVLMTGHVETARAWEAELHSRLDGRGVAFDVVTVPGGEPAEVVRLARRRGTGLLVMGRDSPLLSNGVLPERAGLPVLVVG